MKRPIIKRRWINQPSTLQPFHKFHGRRVLAVYPPDEDNVVDVWFCDADEDFYSAVVPALCLSKGWPSVAVSDLLESMEKDQVMLFSALYDANIDAALGPFEGKEKFDINNYPSRYHKIIREYVAQQPEVSAARLYLQYLSDNGYLAKTKALQPKLYF